MRVPYAVTMVTMAFALVSACDTSAPYSNIVDTTGRGVGFSDYAQYMRAQEELSRIRRAEEARARRVAQAPTDAPEYAQSQNMSIGQEAVAAVRGNTAPQAQPPAMQAQPPATQAQPSATVATAPPLVAGAPLPPAQQTQQTGNGQSAGQTASAQPAAPGASSVSDQQFNPQPFGTPQDNQLVERDFVPPVRVSDAELGQGQSGPNLFVYALSTTHNVGETRYQRNHPLRWRRWESACAQFPSQDLAQEAFLAAGGPERDPNHLDPDGDGFACWWDPAPFRQAARTVRARE